MVKSKYKGGTFYDSGGFVPYRSTAHVKAGSSGELYPQFIQINNYK